MLNERRGTDRFYTENFRISFKVIGEDPVYFGDVVNISSNGFLMLMETTFSVGDRIIIKFPFLQKKILLEGTVIRIEGREAAVRFDASAAELDAFVEQFNFEYQKYRKK